MIFQDPLTALNPVFKVGSQIAEVIQVHESMSRSKAKARAVDLLGEVGIPNPRGRAKEYPAPVLRRHAPARHDRDGVGAQPGAAAGRRADHRPRRHGAGPDHGTAGIASGAARNGDRADHARPRAGGQPRRPRHGDVRRPGGRIRRYRRHFLPAAPRLHPRSAFQSGPARPAPRRAARAHPRLTSQPDPRAAGLPVPSALRVRDEGVPHRRSAAASSRTRPAISRPATTAIRWRRRPRGRCRGGGTRGRAPTSILARRRLLRRRTSRERAQPGEGRAGVLRRSAAALGRQPQEALPDPQRHRLPAQIGAVQGGRRGLVRRAARARRWRSSASPAAARAPPPAPCCGCWSPPRAPSPSTAKTSPTSGRGSCAGCAGRCRSSSRTRTRA